MSLSAAFDPRENALTPLRLLLALFVVFSHGSITGRFGKDFLYRATGEQMELGTVAVIGFFGISGFLLARSRSRTDPLTFLRNRALRIVPALYVSIAVVVLAIVPAAVALGGRASLDDVTGFALHHATFALGGFPVHGLFPGQPYPDDPNISLWTLPVEVIGYVVLAVAPVRMLRALAIELLVVSLVVNARLRGELLFMHLPVAFFSGVALSVVAHRIPASRSVALLLATLLAVASAVGCLRVVAPLILPYLAIWVGITARFRLSRDVSYGTYIYAWPVQQMAGMLGLGLSGFVVYELVTTFVILVVALLSAVLIEEPALRLRRAGLAPGVSSRRLPLPLRARAEATR